MYHLLLPGTLIFVLYENNFWYLIEYQSTIHTGDFHFLFSLYSKTFVTLNMIRGTCDDFSPWRYQTIY